MFESWSVGVILLSLVMFFTSWEASWMLTTAWNCKFSSYYFCLLYSQSTLFILRRSTRWMTLKGACFLSPCLRSSCNKRRTFWEDPMVPENPLAVRRLSDSNSSCWGMTRPQWLSRRRIDSHLDSRTHSWRWHSSWPVRSSSFQIRHKLKIRVPSELSDSSRVCTHISSLPHPRNILGYKPGNKIFIPVKIWLVWPLWSTVWRSWGRRLQPPPRRGTACHWMPWPGHCRWCAALGESPW